MISKWNRRILVMILCLATVLCFGGNVFSYKAYAAGNADVTRGEWLSDLVYTFDMEVEENNMPDDYFADVTSDSEYYEDVMKAAEFGVIDIEAGGNVEPEAPLTREFAAHTLAFCLGYEDDGATSYTFSDTDAVSDDYAAQMAVDRGWLALVGGAFKPDQEVTFDEKDAMMADAETLIGQTAIDTAHENSFTFAQGVVVIPEGTSVTVNEDSTKVTIGGTTYASQLTQGTLFAVYQNGLPVGYKVVSAAAEGGNTVVTTEALENEEILTDADAEGVVEGDLSDFVPAEGVKIVAIESEDGETQTDFRSQKSALRALRGTKKVKDIILSKKISLGDGVSITPSFKITDIKMKYKTKWLSYAYAGVEADVTMSGELKVDMLDALGADKSVFLGGVTVFGVGYVNVTGELGLDGSFNASTTYHLDAGVEKSKGQPVRTIKSFRKTQYSLHTEINAKLGVHIEAGFNVVEMLKGYVYAEGGVKANFVSHEFFDGKLPNRCSTLKGWLYAEYGYHMSAFAGKWPMGSKTYTVYDFSNSPVRIVVHWEDGRMVSKCTRHPEDILYFTKYDSPYGGSYGGYGLDGEGNLVPVFTFEVFENEKAEEEARITGYTGGAGFLEIPETVSDENGEYPVTEIGESAFEERSDVIGVSIPSSVTLIDQNAFFNCPNLTTVTMADSVTEIGEAAFAGDQSLSSVTLSRGLKTVGGLAFGDCDSLRSIEIPKSITKTTEGYIPNITIPVYGAGYTSGVFLGCDNLNDVTFEEGITEIPQGLFAHTTGLRQLTIPETLLTIGTEAFWDCRNLETVNWPGKLSIIKNGAFMECKSLTSGNLPDTITEIQDFAFAEAAFTDLHLPKSLKKAGGGAFAFCNGLTSVEIPKALTDTTAAYHPVYYNQYATSVNGDLDYEKYGVFYKSENLANVTFEEGITRIPDGVLGYTYGLKKLTIPDTVLEIGEFAFTGCRYLEDITFSNKLTNIGPFAFNECVKLSKLEFPESVTEIGHFAFAGDLSLTDLALPKNLSKIGGGAFAKCDGLTEVTIPKSLKTAHSEYSYYYPDPKRGGTSGIFLAAKGPQKVIFEEGTTEILPGILEYSYGLTDIVIPESVTSVGYKAFKECTALKQITIPKSVTAIGDEMLSGCTALTECTLPEGITEIPKECFLNCKSLEGITIPASVTELGESAFEASGLKKVDLPEKLATIEQYAFYDCDALEEIAVPGTVSFMGQGIFKKCDALKSITFGSGITELPDDTLANNTALTSVTLPITLTEIGAGAFAEDAQLKEITIPRSVTAISSDAFSYYSNLTIYGVEGTYAETFAKENGATFVAISRPATDLKVSPTEVNMYTDSEVQLSMTVTPADTTDAVSLKSADTDIVSISSKNTLIGEGPGTTTVKVTAGAISVSVKVTVHQGVSRIYLDTYELDLTAGETYALEAEPWPEDAENKALTWSSSDEKVAVVSDEGVVTALSKGEATIKAAVAADPEIYAECVVTVTGNMTIADKVADLESKHPYDNSSTDNWRYTVAGASSLDVTFSADTEIEDGFDYLYLINADGTEQGKYTGKALAGKTITIKGDTVTIRLVSDESGNAWGFKVTDVKTSGQPYVCTHEISEWIDDENEETHTGTCSKCGETITKKHELEFAETNVPASLTDTGEDQMRCKVCGAIVYVITDPAPKGKCGDKVNYSFDAKTGVLTISGTGAIYDYEEGMSPFAYEYDVTSIVINEGVTVIGTKAFENMPYADSISLPASLKTIKEGAFYNNGFEVINYAGTSEQYDKIDMADDVKSDIDAIDIEAKGDGEEPEVPDEPVQRVHIKYAEPELSQTAFAYTGRAIKPFLAEYIGLTENDDYTLKYKNNKAIGKGYVIVTGVGEYYGTYTLTFRIVPKKAVLSKVTPGKKRMTVKIKSKVATTGGSVYQIAYRVKGTSKWKYTTTKTQSKVIKKLKKGKKYQVKVRAYKSVSGTKYYGAWSTVKTTKKIK